MNDYKIKTVKVQRRVECPGEHQFDAVGAQQKPGSWQRAEDGSMTILQRQQLRCRVCRATRYTVWTRQQAAAPVERPAAVGSISDLYA